MVIDDAFIKKFEMQIDILKSLQSRVEKAIRDAQPQIEELKQGMKDGKSVEEVFRQK